MLTYAPPSEKIPAIRYSLHCIKIQFQMLNFKSIFHDTLTETILCVWTGYQYILPISSLSLSFSLCLFLLTMSWVFLFFLLALLILNAFFFSFPEDTIYFLSFLLFFRQYLTPFFSFSFYVFLNFHLFFFVARNRL